jgi:hypothetical protein
MEPLDHKRQIDRFQELDRTELVHTFLRACVPARKARLERVQARYVANCSDAEFEREIERSGLLPIVRHLYPLIESQGQ